MAIVKLDALGTNGPAYQVCIEPGNVNYLCMLPGSTGKDVLSLRMAGIKDSTLLSDTHTVIRCKFPFLEAGTTYSPIPDYDGKPALVNPQRVSRVLKSGGHYEVTFSDGSNLTLHDPGALWVDR